MTAPAITGRTRLAAVIGWPVAHSRSPEMLNAAFDAAGIDAVLVPIAAAPHAFPSVIATLRATGALGASVTTPHKLAAAALCDELDADANAIGAVNCLHIDAGRVIGRNTDAGGFTDALAEHGLAIAGGRAVLLGAGGAARAIAHGLASTGATVEIVSRTPPRWRAGSAGSKVAMTSWPELADALSRADLVVDCTPTGLHAASEPAFVDALPLDRLRVGSVVASLVYHRRPLVLAQAEALGHRTLDGAGMLVHQGARAFQHWTGRAAPIAIMHRALAEAITTS